MTLYNDNNGTNYKNVKMEKCRSCCCNFFLLILGITFITFGLLLFIYFEPISDFFLRNAMTFGPDTEPYRVWRTNDPPLLLDIYLFNWTNPEDILVKGVKPKFQEVGPYRFKEIKEKINVTWHDHNNTISYRHRKLYIFDEGNSPKPLSEVLNMVNIIPLAIAYQARYFGYFSKLTVSYSLSTFSSLYVTKTAGEILFDGYEDSMLSILNSVPMTEVNDKFGLFYGKNNSVGGDGVFSMYTKVDENFGKILSWNFQNSSDYFEGECNAVKGSAGEFHPFNRTRDSIEIFSSELCKFAKLEYEKDVVVKGVKGYKYTGRHVFDNGTLRPENKCFCSGECHPSGVFNVSSCRQNSPAFISMPHFYAADPYYVNAIEGVKPEDKHEFYITLEPRTGIVIDIGAKIQVNMLMQPIEYIKMYENVPRVLMPIFYFDQTLLATDDLASLLVRIQSLPEISNVAVMILESLGIGSLIWVLLNIYCNSRKQKKEEEDVQTEMKFLQNTVNAEDMTLRC